MSDYSLNNEKIKKKYFEYAHEAKGRSPKTIREMTKHLYRFDQFIGFKDYGKDTISSNTLSGFKNALRGTKNQRTGDTISASTIIHSIKSLRDFLGWLSQQKGFGFIKPAILDYLTLMPSERQITTTACRPVPNLEQIQRLVFSLSDKSLKQKRDQALIALFCLTGIRIESLMTLTLGAFQTETQTLYLSEKTGVKTKGGKIICATLIPLDQRVEDIFLNWVKILKINEGFKKDDPMFPRMRIERDGDTLFCANTYKKQSIQSPTTIREVLKDACKIAGIEYLNPHIFRKFITMHFFEKGLNPAEVKAISQNLGHTHIMTTFYSYGQQPIERQIKLVRDLKRFS